MMTLAAVGRWRRPLPDGPARVVERLLACVEGHPVEGADTGVTLVGDHEVLVAGETLRGAVKEGHGVHFAALDGHDAVVHIGNDLDDDAVDVRLALMKSPCSSRHDGRRASIPRT